MKRVLGSIRRADERYHLFEDGDKVCIGVSGGKDSLLLMDALQLYKQFSKTRFEVCAVSLDLGIVEQDWSAVTAFAERIGMDRSFTSENARSLRWIAWLAAGDAAAVFVGNAAFLLLGLSHPGVLLLSLLIVFAGIAIAVAAAVLSHLVQKAAGLQEQSDLTI